MSNATYQLLDSGDLKKLEQIGPYKIIRPCAQAIWKKNHRVRWDDIDVSFSREKENTWTFHSKAPPFWILEHKGLAFKIHLTQFGHIGIFPEHLDRLDSLKHFIKSGMRVLNLFAYTGAASIFCAKLGAKVTHVDASKTSISWAKDNACLNRLDENSIRWIVDDALKFLKREVRRLSLYDAIILDPPSYGKGSSSQVFKIEKDIHDLLLNCKKILSDKASFVLFSCHTPGFTGQTMQYLMQDYFSDLGGDISSGEMLIQAKDSHHLPSGTYGFWNKQ